MENKSCFDCGFWDGDFGCTCSPLDKWYACPFESGARPEDFLEEKEEEK